MNTSKSLTVTLLLFLLLSLSSVIKAQDNNEELEELKKLAPKVYLDCITCDKEYYKDTITYVNFVRDRKGADIHVLVTGQSTGGGGMEYKFTFIGLEEFEGIEHTLSYTSRAGDTRDDTRRGQVEVMERGIFPFLIQSPICNYINLDFRQRLEPTDVEDPWNSWVFSLNIDGRVNGQSSRTSSSLNANFSANRVTPEIKWRFGFSSRNDRRTYHYDEYDIISDSSSNNLDSMMVKSLSDHWSIGGWVEAETSTYSNIDFIISATPALEYSFFPYAESTRRDIRLLYRVGMDYADYTELTLYEKTKETLWRESLMFIMEFKQPWGNISGSLEGSHYFHDFKKNRFVISGDLSVRLVKGLSLTLRGNYQQIRDQLNLPISNYDLDEVLLARKELQTDYEYSFSVGVRYTFGSVYSNVVNPRFGIPHFRGGGGGMY